MKKKIFLFYIAILVFSTSFSQNNFESGYYINNANQKVEGYIKNLDWFENPTTIKFKSSIDSNVLDLNIENVKEFSIPKKFKYERHTVEVALPKTNVNNFDYQRNPTFETKTIFLLVLASKPATLYEYSKSNSRAFFYKNESEQQELTQLVFKKYFTKNNKIGVNNYFKQQLVSLTENNTELEKLITRIDYNKNDLLSFFTKYNSKSGNNENLYKKPIKKTKFNISILTGLTSSKVSVLTENMIFNGSDNINPTIGIEAEAILPFNNNKWSLFSELKTLNYRSEVENMDNSNQNIELSLLDLNLGARHYLFLNSNTKLFLTAGYGFDFGSLKFEDIESDRTTGSIELGIGVSYKRFSGELRYIGERDHLGTTFIFNQSEYKSLAILFKYNIFSL